MITSIIVAIAAVLTLFFLLKSARGQEAPIRKIEELVNRTEPVDIQAFRNLIDPQEEDYLRANLPITEFRQVQRARMRAAIDYVRRTSHNAALLIRIGQATRKHSNPEIVRAAEQLANSALLLRIYSMLALAYFYGRILAPTLRLGSSSFVDRYEGLRDNMARLARLHTPAAVSQVDSAL
jgi:hypothetical protein